MLTTPRDTGTNPPVRPRGTRRTWVAMGVAAGGTAALLSWRKSGEETGSSTPRAEREARIPDVPVLTHDGRAVHFYSDLVRGRIVFISMMYAQCTQRCPPVTQYLKRVHALLGERVGRDIHMYSISLRPEFDRPQDLRAYMQTNAVPGVGWTFLTGERMHIERLRRALGFFTREAAVDEDINQHTGMVCIGNDALDRWCMTPATLPPEKIVDTLMAIDPVARANGRHAH